MSTNLPYDVIDLSPSHPPNFLTQSAFPKLIPNHVYRKENDFGKGPAFTMIPNCQGFSDTKNIGKFEDYIMIEETMQNISIPPFDKNKEIQPLFKANPQ
jgi:hypothetical protein